MNELCITYTGSFFYITNYQYDTFGTLRNISGISHNIKSDVFIKDFASACAYVNFRVYDYVLYN